MWQVCLDITCWWYLLYNISFVWIKLGSHYRSFKTLIDCEICFHIYNINIRGIFNHIRTQTTQPKNITNYKILRLSGQREHLTWSTAADCHWHLKRNYVHLYFAFYTLLNWGNFRSLLLFTLCYTFSKTHYKGSCVITELSQAVSPFPLSNTPNCTLTIVKLLM